MTERIDYVRVGSGVVRRRTAVCADCGRWFERGHGNMKRCGPCRRSHVRDYNHRRYLERKAALDGRQHIVTGPMPCKSCRMTVYYGGSSDDARWQIRDRDGQPHRCAA